MAFKNPDLMLVKRSDKASQKRLVDCSRPGNLAIDTHAKVVVSGESTSLLATWWKEPAPKLFANEHCEEGWSKDGQNKDHPGFGPIGTAWVELMMGCVGFRVPTPEPSSII
jgi:hypothetical protein